MPGKITDVPTALLRENGGLVQEGDMLPLGVAGDRRVRLISTVPDADGLVTVEEVYRVRPDEVGLRIRPRTIITELTEKETRALLDFYHEAMGKGHKPDPDTEQTLENLGKVAGEIEQ